MGLKQGQQLAENAQIQRIVTHLTFEVHLLTPAGTYIVEAVPQSAGTPSAVTAKGFHFAWRGGPDADEPLGLALCEAVAERFEVADAVPMAAAERDARVRHVTGGRILAPAGQGAGRFWALEPYVGCLIGCRFCYAQTRLSAWRDALSMPPVPWGSWVDVRVDAAQALRRDLADFEALPVKFSPVRSDPYHAVEARENVTRACLEVLRELPPPATIVLTRSKLVERDLDLLAAIPNAMLGFSMPTNDDRMRRHFEPRAAAIHERIEVLNEAQRRGLRTFAVVQPMLPGNPHRLAELLAGCVDSVSLDTLHGVHGAADDFADPDLREALDPAWQQDRLHELAALLTDFGVKVWQGELPPG